MKQEREKPKREMSSGEQQTKYIPRGYASITGTARLVYHPCGTFPCTTNKRTCRQSKWIESD